ncbi:hypothetical protein BN2537_259 [Streptomyces venezuelae]|nr:hypothetical protein BN2537_259 [Streptomyces venezuelae]
MNNFLFLRLAEKEVSAAVEADPLGLTCSNVRLRRTGRQLVRQPAKQWIK